MSTKFDLAVKYNPGSPLKENYNGQESPMLHTKFRGNQSAMGFIIYWHGSHLIHVTSIILIYFHFHLPKVYIQNLVKNGQVVSEKSLL